MRRMDLNADIGEGGLQDVALIALVRGDESSMRSAIDACLAAGVAIGAHPGYEDRKNFACRVMDLAPAAVADWWSGSFPGLVERIVPRCGFYVPPAGQLALAGADAGLRVRADGFMERSYAENGQLVCRSLPDAVIDDVGAAVSQALEIALHRRVRTVADISFPLPANPLRPWRFSPSSRNPARRAPLIDRRRLQTPSPMIPPVNVSRETLTGN